MIDQRLLRIEGKIDKIDITLSNIARVEERIAHLMAQMNSVLTTMSQHDERIRVLEQHDAAQAPVLSMWEKVVTAVLTGGGILTALWAFASKPWASGG